MTDNTLHASDVSASTNDASRSKIRLDLPLSHQTLSELLSGDAVLLNGPIFTMRDAGHQRCLDYLRENGELPYGLQGQTLFYAGPTPPKNGLPFGSI